MNRSIYDERDYPFGQGMLTLRTSIGLTQSGLADLLGVSRRSVGEWEAGNSYPKVERLKQLIELAIKQQAFPVGSEAQAIRDLWAAARQKTLLDEQWLSSLLKPQSSPPSSAAAPPSEESTSSQPIDVPLAASGPLLDWGQALEVPNFYGREQEMTQLSGWVLQERCRVVILLGMGGIGKSALTVQVMHQLAVYFEAVIFRPLRDVPSCEELLDDCLQVLAPQPLRAVPTNLEERLNLLLERLRSSRTLLVLDNLESLLEEGNVQGHLRPGFEGYERLLRQVAETTHQSCLLLTSREKPAILRPLEGLRSPVHSLRLTGLDSSACEQLFAENEVEGTPQEQIRLAEAYAGNPLALKMVTETIVDLFGGQISQFLAGETVIFGNIVDLLQEQFVRLSSLEQTVLYWLAIVREPITFNELRAVLVTAPPQMQFLEAIDALRRRSLIERGQRQGSFTLQSVVLEYVTRVLIKKTTHEIQQHTFKILIEHGLEQASAREYVRQTQERLLLIPILTNLQSAYRRKAQVEELLISLLDELRQRADYAQGYGPAILIALLRLRLGQLKGLDLSHLVIRGAYLRGIEMQDTSLAGALLRDTVFTEVLNAPWSIAVSGDGEYWAVGSMQGEIHVWRQGIQKLHLVWLAHTDTPIALSFSPDGRTLASGSWDGSVKLWDLKSGALLWTGWHEKSINSVAFAPDGSLLASSGNDESVRLWDPQSGTNLQTLPHSYPVYAIAWSPDGHLLVSGDFEGNILWWETLKTSPTIRHEICLGHSNWVTGLAFAPDGYSLASASWDRTVKLWESASGCLLQTFSEYTDRVNRVAWSPDGRTLASCGYDKTIWLWDVEQGRYRAVLHGHVDNIFGLTFTPDSNNLLSGSEDGTLRVWDVATGQCIHAMQGYAVSFYDIDWSPDSTLLVSGGTDRLVTIWHVSSGSTLRVLHGHKAIVFGLAWSPDGRFIASSGWDNIICLWNTTTGTCVQVIRDPDNPNTTFEGVMWKEHLLVSGTNKHGLQMWDTTTHSRRWVGRTIDPIWIDDVAWSSDGTRLASSSDDGGVYLWDAANGMQLQRLQGHHGRVIAVAWSPDGNRLASCGGREGRGELFVWNAQSGECVRALREQSEIVSAIAWNPSKDLLVSGGSDGTLHWWDARSGECIKIQTAHRGTVQSIKISPDARWLASCGDDGAIMIWDLQSAEHLRTLRQDRPYERLNITGIKGLTDAQKSTLRALGATEEGATFL